MRLVFLIGGTIAGYLTGNFYAAVIFAALSLRFAERMKQDEIPGKAYRTKFILSIIEMMVAIAKADGVFVKKELEYIKNFLRYYFHMDGKIFAWYMDYTRKITNEGTVNLKKSFAAFNKYSNEHEQHFILQCLCELVLTDAKIDPKQKRIIFEFARVTNIARSEVIRILNKQLKHTPDHYLILGAKPSMSQEDIRKKYIELAKFFHPDRFRHRPLDEQQYADEKMKKINDAWSKVLKEKQLQSSL